jgi:phosphatidylserine decarboxylase
MNEPAHLPSAAAVAGDDRFAEDQAAPPFAPEGVPIIAAFVVGAVVLTGLAWWLHPAAGIVVGMVTLVLCGWCLWFFRDPRRRIPISRGGRRTIVSPADGVVSYVGPASPPSGVGLTESDVRGTTRVSVFMNVFNVHVNRAPIDCNVLRLVYNKGKFVNASLDKASEHNERMSLVLDVPGMGPLVCVQIAGLIARRIVCRVGEGTALRTGERFGLIRFGSRVDVYLPGGVEPLVRVGQKTVAGETVLALLPVSAGAANVNGVMGAPPPALAEPRASSPARAGEAAGGGAR